MRFWMGFIGVFVFSVLMSTSVYAGVLCDADSDCNWCGSSCVTSEPFQICTQDMPPIDQNCLCVENTCTAVDSVTSTSIVITTSTTVEETTPTTSDSPSDTTSTTQTTIDLGTPTSISVPSNVTQVTGDVTIVTGMVIDESESVVVSSNETVSILPIVTTVTTVSRVSVSRACLVAPDSEKMECLNNGGRFFTSYDPNNPACAISMECVIPVSDGDVYDEFDEDDIEVPSNEVLLSVAFKLEDVKLSLDRLSRKSSSIASYYSSVDEQDQAQKFHRIVSGLEAAKGKVDDIRGFLRSRIDTISKDDIIQVKRDIVYLRKVVLKDLLYIVLSDSVYSDSEDSTVDPVGDVVLSSDGCGDDFDCFYKGFRLCEVGTDYMPGGGSFGFDVTGFDGENCVIEATLNARDQSGDFLTNTATCKNPKYSLGYRGEYTFFSDSECSGSLVNFLEKSPLPVEKPQIAPHLGGGYGPPIEESGCDTVELKKEVSKRCIDDDKDLGMRVGDDGCYTYFCVEPHE